MFVVYFPESAPVPAESYAPDDVVPSAADAELRLVDEYRESGFDPGEVQEFRQVVADIEEGEYSADDWLAAYDDDEDDVLEPGYGEPERGGLIDLGNGVQVTPEVFAQEMQRQTSLLRISSTRTCRIIRTSSCRTRGST